jgi:hypothetical protein
MENDWIDVLPKYNYDVKCDLCGLEFSIEQNHSPLDAKMLKEIIVITHNEDTYDCYTSYKHGVKIECEIIGNKQCNNILKAK